ncbi:DegT/DnrJ/EryC1/StrS family aminotransferase [Gammaproteobacteria bacterium]|nr:DegT/DnrJ/EryC1/StrS family aminotransferase [Gammaproteobacteria bacterium]
MEDKEFIPVNTPFFNGNEKRYLNECIDSGWISSEGAFVKKFEDDVSSYIKRDYATACSNGSAALDIAIGALELKSGDEVIMPSFTIISCAQSLITRGVKPVLVDSDYKTFNMKIEDIEAKISSNTKAIMIVHIYGLTVDVDPVLALAKKHDLKVIEDAAEMFGQNYKDNKCGSFGDISTFSFYPNKHITTGEGGMVLTNDKTLDDRSKSLRNLCFTKDRFIHEEIGYNYRMTNMQAAIGVAQLEQIEDMVIKKRWIGDTYNKLLKDIDSINLPIIETDYCKNIYWVYALTLKDDFKKTPQEVMHELAKLNIGTRPFFYPMHKQPIFNKMGFFKEDDLPISEKLYERGFYIPSGLALTEGQIQKVSDAMHEVLL